MKKKAEMGIGTLILFIAMILVAAIAAGVLVRTATSLQSRALVTGERSKDQVSTSVMPILIAGTNGSDNNLENFFMKAKLVPGSEPIKLNDSALQFDLNNDAAELAYGIGACSYDAGETAGGTGGFWTNSSGEGFFTVTYLENATNHVDHYLHSGDVVMICWRAPRSVAEDEEVIISFVPKVGNVMQVETALPSVMTTQRIILFP